MLFQGEEWLAGAPFQYFTDHDDAALAEAVRRGRQEEFAAFGWRPEDVPDPQAETTFARSCLVWEEARDGVHAEVLDWHRRLIALRRAFPELRDGRFGDVEVAAEGEHWLAVTRGRITVACNFSRSEPAAVRLRADAEVLLASHPEVCRRRSLTLPPLSVAVAR